MTKLVYPCKATKTVKPSILRLEFTISENGHNPKAILTSLNNTISMAKDFCTSKKSYRPDSYTQSDISFKDTSSTEYYYQNVYTNLKKSVKEYENLSAEEQHKYKKYSRKAFIDYSVSTNISIILNNSDTVIQDFTDIVNMAIENNMKCNYLHDILEEERQKYMRQLYVDCINTGMKEISEIANGVNYFDPKDIQIIQVGENLSNSGFVMSDTCYKESRADVYEPEKFFIPELVKELFNNNIVLTKKLDIEVRL